MMGPDVENYKPIEKTDAVAGQNERIVMLIAKTIAREIMECGDNPGSPTKRIQFMGGNLPDNEIGQGGLCEIALIDVIERSLKGIFTT